MAQALPPDADAHRPKPLVQRGDRRAAIPRLRQTGTTHMAGGLRKAPRTGRNSPPLNSRPGAFLAGSSASSVPLLRRRRPVSEKRRPPHALRIGIRSVKVHAVTAEPVRVALPGMAAYPLRRILVLEAKHRNGRDTAVNLCSPEPFQELSPASGVGVSCTTHLSQARKHSSNSIFHNQLRFYTTTRSAW